MKRVLGRIYPPTEDKTGVPGTRRGDGPCELLLQENALQRMLGSVTAASGECRSALRGVYRRSAQRAARLRVACFLRRGSLSGREAPRRRGVLTALREIHRALETLSEEYEKAAAVEPRQREEYMRFAGECRADAQTVRALIDRAMG